MRLKQLSNPLRVGKGLQCFLALFVMLMAPQGAWAEDYVLTVAGQSFTAEQLSGTSAINVTSDNITEGTVTLTPAASEDEPVMLTLNGATISDKIVSTIDLKVMLIGYNTISHECTMTDPDPCFKGNGNSLIFTTEPTNPGALFVSQTSAMDEFASGWGGSSSTPIWDKSKDDPTSYDWWVDQGCAFMTLKTNTRYDLKMDGYQTSDAWFKYLNPYVESLPVYMDNASTLVVSGEDNFAITSNMSALTLKVLGQATLSSIRFEATDKVSTGTLTIAQEGTHYEKYSLSLTNNKDNLATIKGFSSVQVAEPMGLRLPKEAPASWDTYQGTVFISNYDSYGLEVGGVAVTSDNASAITGDNISGNVSYDVITNTLTMSGATISGRIFSSLEDGLKVNLVGNNIIDGEYEENNTNKPGEIAFVTESEYQLPLTFTTSETSPGKLLMKNTARNGEVSMYYQGFSESFENGLSYSSKDNKRLIAKAPSLTPGEGIYWTDQEYTISGPAGATIEYQDYLNKIAKTTYSGEPFTMTTTGKYALGVWQTLTVDETAFTLNGKGGSYIVHNKPTFSPVAGTYDGSQQITLANLPTDLATTDETYPQVWYYLGENTNESVQITSAEQKIEVSESTKVCVYILDVDSGKTYKSATAEAEYTIRQDPRLAFVQGESPVEVVDYIIGGNENPEMPTLQNENNLAITYNSSNTDVATINTEGVVTIVGVGETRISATSEQTDVLSEGYAEYPLRVYKGLNHESISVKVDDAIYTGEPIEQDVTVKDGETSINEYVNIVYSDNTELGTATVTITPKTDMDKENYYIGSTTAMFTISYRTLKVGEDVVFAGGQKWATYYNPEENLNLPKGIGAFVATGVGDGVVTVSQIKYIPEGEAVLLNNDTETAGTVVFNSDVDTNLLKHADEDVDAENAVIYGLYNGSFMRVKGTIPAGKNYLQLMTLVNNLPSNQPQAPELTIIFEGDVTGVKGVKDVREVKDNTFYSLDGRKVQKPSKKGLYISDGRKVVVK